MNAENINAIITAVLVVSSNYFNWDIERGDPFIINNRNKHFNNMIINIGLTGDLNGQCILSFSDDN